MKHAQKTTLCKTIYYTLREIAPTKSTFLLYSERIFITCVSIFLRCQLCFLDSQRTQIKTHIRERTDHVSGVTKLSAYVSAQTTWLHPPTANIRFFLRENGTTSYGCEFFVTIHTAMPAGE